MKPTLQDEYNFLGTELRQNRQIQLNVYLSVPVWMSLFFGLVTEEMFNKLPLLIMLPVAMMLLNLLLIADRRKSADMIIAYFRTAYDQQMAKEPKWNYLLPTFRKNFSSLDTNGSIILIPQRFDFHVGVWLSFFVLSIICTGIFVGITEISIFYAILIFALIAVLYLLVLKYHYKLSKKKTILLEAWRKTLIDEFGQSSENTTSVEN